MNDATPVALPQEEGIDQAQEIQNVIDEQVTGEAAVVQDEKEQAVLEGNLEQLGVLEASLEHLVDLRASINREGVSAEDIRTLFTIRDKIKGDTGFELPLNASLEEFGDKLFLQTRSPMGLEVSQESIVTTVLDAIKKWLKIFKEMIIKAIRWLKLAVHNDATVERRVDDALKRVKEIRISAKRLEAMLPRAFDSTGLSAYAGELLADKSLKRNTLTLAALGDIDKLTEVREIYAKAMVFTGWMDKHLTSIDEFVRGKIDSLPYADVTANALLDLNTLMGLVKTESPDPKYLLKHTSQLVDNRLFLPREVFVYSDTLKTYYRAVDFVRLLEKDLQQAKAPESVLSEVSKQIGTVNQCYAALDNIVKFFIEYNQIQLQVLGLMYKYANKEYTMVWDQISVSEILSDQIQKKVEQIDKDLRAFLKVQFRA